MTTVDWATDGQDLRTPSGADTWAAAVRAAMTLLGRRPLHEVTLEQVASMAGIRLDTVLEQIPDLNELMVAVVQEWYAQRMREVRVNAESVGTVSFLRDLLSLSIRDSACTRVTMTAASIAGSPDHPSAGVLRQMWVRFHAVVQRALTYDVTIGREPTTMNPSDGAEQLIAIYEGLQFQWLFRPNMDLLAAYDRAITRLRHGWAEAYTAPVWDI